MKKKSITKPDNINNILKKVISKIEKKDLSRKEIIKNAWLCAVGEKGDKHSRPISIRKKVLNIEVDSSTWMYELNLKKRDILESVKKDLGENKIKDIRFRIGEIN